MMVSIASIGESWEEPTDSSTGETNKMQHYLVRFTEVRTYIVRVETTDEDSAYDEALEIYGEDHVVDGEYHLESVEVES